MRACATPGGGVMFIPDELETTAKKVSFADLVQEEAKTEAKPKRMSWFGRRKKEDKLLQDAA